MSGLPLDEFLRTLRDRGTSNVRSDDETDRFQLGSGQQATTLREKWSIATSTQVGQMPHRHTRVRSIDQT